MTIIKEEDLLSAEKDEDLLTSEIGKLRNLTEYIRSNIKCPKSTVKKRCSFDEEDDMSNEEFSNFCEIYGISLDLEDQTEVETEAETEESYKDLLILEVQNARLLIAFLKYRICLRKNQSLKSPS